MTSQETGRQPRAQGTVPWAGRVKVPHDLVVRRLEVVDVRRLTPTIVRVTLGGPDLQGFTSLGPTGHVKVYFPDPVTGVLTPPTLVAGVLGRPHGAPVHVRDYTARAHRPDGAHGPELDIDIVLHGDSGPASAWAARASRGQTLVVAGPKSSKLLPTGAAAVLLGCDETGLPAVGRWLELLPAHLRVTVLAEVDSPAEESYLGPGGDRPGLDLRWLHRKGAPAGTGGLLEQAVRGYGPVDRETFVWFAGEAGSLVGVRRYLRRELGLPSAQVEMTGYWRRGQADFDHHAPLDPKDPD